MKKLETERRKSSRCQQELGIAFSFLNTKERYVGVMRNYSRFGMYFETDRTISPGTLIVIQPLACGRVSSWNISASSYRADTENAADSAACRQLKTLVVAQVKRCEKVLMAELECQGIGVHYVSPPV